MIINETVMVKWNSSNKKWFVQKGYNFTKMDDEFEVNVEDLSKGSHIEVNIKCDYCNSEFKKKYYKFIKQRETSGIEKDCCSECRLEKMKDVFLHKYGVTQNTQIKEVKENLSKIFREDETKVREDFKKLGYNIVEPFNYVNDFKKISFVCEKHPEQGIQNTNYRVVKHHEGGCKKCRYEKISGDSCHLWKGGTTPIETYLRDKILNWKFKSMEKSNFLCELSGFKFDVIHHLYPFTYICEESLKILNIKNKGSVSNYTKVELQYLEDKCIELHEYYGYGVCLNLKLHLLYHAKYHKNEEINKDAFNEFRNRYYNGEFDNELEEEIKSYNSIKRLKNLGVAI